MNKLRLILTFLLAVCGSATAGPEQLTSPVIKGAPDFSAISNASAVRTQLGAAPATDRGGVYLSGDVTVSDDEILGDTQLARTLTAGAWLIKVSAVFLVESGGVEFDCSYSGATPLRETVKVGANDAPAVLHYGFVGSLAMPLETPGTATCGVEIEIVVTVATTGTVTFRFAQAGASDIATDTLKAGASMTFEKLANP